MPAVANAVEPIKPATQLPGRPGEKKTNIVPAVADAGGPVKEAKDKKHKTVTSLEGAKAPVAQTAGSNDKATDKKRKIVPFVAIANIPELETSQGPKRKKRKAVPAAAVTGKLPMTKTPKPLLSRSPHACPKDTDVLHQFREQRTQYRVERRIRFKPKVKCS